MQSNTVLVLFADLAQNGVVVTMMRKDASDG